MPSRTPSRDRNRSRTRSQSPRSEGSRPASRRRRYDSRSPSRSPTSPRRNGRYRSESRSRSRSRSRSLSRGRGGRDSRDRSFSPSPRSTKIVVERLSKNITEQHLREVFGQFGNVKDLDLPINRTFGTNRGTAYILFEYLEDAEAAIANMHESQVDGAMINVSIVLPRRKLSPAPPTARRGANIDPRLPPPGPRGGGPPGSAAGAGFNSGGGGGGRRHPSPGGRYGPRSDVYRPMSRSPSRSPPAGGAPPSRTGGGRYRSRSPLSYSSRFRSRSPGAKAQRNGSRAGDNDGRLRDRSASHRSRGDRDRSHSPARGSRDYC